jgi:hypothetical protein
MTSLNQNHESDKVQSEKITSFPIHVFHKTIQEIMRAYQETLGYNYDYMGAAFLFATSLAIGNKLKLIVKKGWLETAIIWFCVVGKSGVGKTHPIAKFLEPFRDVDRLNFEKYKVQLEEYNIKIQEINKKEKRKGKELNETNEPEPEKPQRKQFIIQDFTVESLCQALDVNSDGIGVYSDELTMWLDNMNRYTKSGEEQFYLSTWSSREINVNRRSQPHIYIASPFINVIGSIQIDIMAQTLGKSRQKSGFTNRFLFAFPQKLIRESFSELEISDLHVYTYNRYINDIIKNRTTGEQLSIKLSKDALRVFKEWRAMNNDRINIEEDGNLTGIWAKLEIYLLRLSLVIQVMDDTMENIKTEEVGQVAFSKSIELIKYFENTAIRVNSVIMRYTDPLINYSMDKKIVYAALPTEFQTNEGIKIATKLNMPKRTFQDFITDDTLFKKIKHGLYEKKQ